MGAKATSRRTRLGPCELEEGGVILKVGLEGIVLGEGGVEDLDLGIRRTS